MATHTAPDDIELLVLGSLSAASLAEVHAHLLVCPPCQERVMDEQESRYHIDNEHEQEQPR